MIKSVKTTTRATTKWFVRRFVRGDLLGAVSGFRIVMTSVVGLVVRSRPAVTVVSSRVS